MVKCVHFPCASKRTMTIAWRAWKDETGHRYVIVAAIDSETNLAAVSFAPKADSFDREPLSRGIMTADRPRCDATMP